MTYNISELRKKAGEDGAGLSDAEFKTELNKIMRLVYYTDFYSFKDKFGKLDGEMKKNFRWLYGEITDRDYEGIGMEDIENEKFNEAKDEHELYNTIKQSAVKYFENRWYYKYKKQVDTGSIEPSEMLAKLKKGDSILRGSSKEYQEIQNCLRVLDSIKTDAKKNKLPDGLFKRLIMVCVDSIADKAEKYVAAREQREIENWAHDYGAKRVILMREVHAAMEMQKIALKNEIKEKDPEKITREDAQKFKGYLETIYNSTAFSGNIYSELRTIEEKLDKKNEEISYTDNDVKTFVNDYKVEILEKGLGGRKIPLESAKTINDKMKEFVDRSMELDNYAAGRKKYVDYKKEFSTGDKKVDEAVKEWTDAHMSFTEVKMEKVHGV